MHSPVGVASFGWLHFSDLHQGLDAHGWLYPGARDVVFDDLELLHQRCGPWDLVLFSGDLTQHGSTVEFSRLNDSLQQLWDHLLRLGSTPALIATPGNHDLVRPDPRRPEARLLRDADSGVLAEFWREASPYRALVEQAFAPYNEWQHKHPFNSLSVRPGLLPGDCSVLLSKGGFKLGVVCLNTSFLQLGDGDYLGQLRLDARQFHAACGGDGPAWVHECDFALLMTHHGPSWLQPRARDEFRSQIAPPGRFVAHIYGHMHAHPGITASLGGPSAQREFQGSSLFGLEKLGDGQTDRSFGYAAANITVDDNNVATLRWWPRKAKKNG